MSLLRKMNVGDSLLLSSNHFSGEYDQNLYIKRTFNNEKEKTKYYINAYSLINGQMVRQGYVYFYLDNKMMSSDFIGVKVEEEYRGLNIGSLLIASWINLCLNNGYDFLGANEKQRKPFLLYLLKTYGFEIFDQSLYHSRDDVITICRSENESDKTKMLLFKNLNHQKNFIKTNVYKTDNYRIVSDKEKVIVLDDIIMPLQNMKKSEIKYYLFDIDKASEKSQKVLLNHRK